MPDTAVAPRTLNSVLIASHLDAYVRLRSVPIVAPFAPSTGTQTEAPLRIWDQEARVIGASSQKR